MWIMLKIHNVKMEWSTFTNFEGGHETSDA
jgi:hypothetical protein